MNRRFSRSALIGWTVIIAGLLVTALPAMAQEEVRSQVNLQHALAGTGALRFVPTSDAMSLVPGTQGQTRAVFLYGGGANFDLTRNIGIRAEYRGLLSKTPDFGLSTLTMGTKTHFAQPSIGVYFRF